MTEFLTETAVVIDGDVRPLADVLDEMDTEDSMSPLGGELDEPMVSGCQPTGRLRSYGRTVVQRVAYPVAHDRDLDWRERQFKD